MNFFDSHKKYFFAFFCVLCIVLAGVTTNRLAPTVFEKTFGLVLTPVHKGIDIAGDWVSKRIKAVTNINSLIDENMRLKEENEKLRLENSSIELLKTDNARLTELLDLSEKYKELDTTGARIIAKDPGNWYDVFIIDKGTNDGLEKNMSVISEGGLVGRIAECGFNYSKVVSIIDDSDAVSSVCLRTGDAGYVSGDYQNRGMCKMELIDSTAKISEGDEILTSPFSSIYPEGITIGKVLSIESSAETSTKTAVIEPVADFKHLDSVLIITSKHKNNNILFADDIGETVSASETEAVTVGE